MNPIEYGAGLTLNISEEENSLDLNLALSVVKYFRVDEKKAIQIIDQVKAAVSTWRSLAKKYHIPNTEQGQMSKAFIV